MGATSARRALAILANSEHAAAIEALAASQGLDLRGMEPAPATKAVKQVIRETSPELVEDRSLSADIEAVRELIADGRLVAAVEGEVGPIN